MLRHCLPGPGQPRARGRRGPLQIRTMTMVKIKHNNNGDNQEPSSYNIVQGLFGKVCMGFGVGPCVESFGALLVMLL